MAHFAKIGIGNKVTEVIVIHNDVAPTEEAGQNFIKTLYKTNDLWIKTSYNTIGGVHRLGGTPFGKNYASLNYKYDEVRDAFIPPEPYASWILDEDTCQWNPPSEKPDESGGKHYHWDEVTKSWKEEAEL